MHKRWFWNSIPRFVFCYRQVKIGCVLNHFFLSLYLTFIWYIFRFYSFLFFIFLISFPFSSLKCFYILDELESLPPPPPVFQTYGTNRGKSVHLFFRKLFLHTVRFIKLWNSPILMLNSPTNLSTKLCSVHRQVSFN